MSGGVAPSIPKADFGGGAGPASAVLPMSVDERKTPHADDILVVFKVCSTDKELVRRATAIIQGQLAGQRVGERGISVVISDEDIEMSVTTKQEIAAKIAPLVASALGVTLR